MQDLQDLKCVGVREDTAPKISYFMSVGLFRGVVGMVLVSGPYQKTNAEI